MSKKIDAVANECPLDCDCLAVRNDCAFYRSRLCSGVQKKKEGNK